jgi:hypothetical protein
MGEAKSLDFAGDLGDSILTDGVTLVGDVGPIEIGLWRGAGGAGGFPFDIWELGTRSPPGAPPTSCGLPLQLSGSLKGRSKDARPYERVAGSATLCASCVGRLGETSRDAF